MKLLRFVCGVALVACGLETSPDGRDEPRSERELTAEWGGALPYTGVGGEAIGTPLSFRLRGPLSTAAVSPNPRLSFFFPNPTRLPVRVEVCSDPTCENIIWSQDVLPIEPVTTVQPDTPLAPGVHFWRARHSYPDPLDALHAAPQSTHTWQFWVDSSLTSPASSGSYFDPNRDGHADWIHGLYHSGDDGLVEIGLSDGTSIHRITQTLIGDGEIVGHGLRRRIYAAALAVGDLNGDGRTDLVVGAPSASVPGMEEGWNEGRFDVRLAGTDGVLGPPLWFRPPEAWGRDNSAFGRTVEIIDINQDGYGDVLVGSPDASGNGSQPGRIAAYLGSPSGIWFDAERTLDDADPADGYRLSGTETNPMPTGDFPTSTILGMPLLAPVFGDATHGDRLVAAGDEEIAYFGVSDSDPSRLVRRLSLPHEGAAPTSIANIGDTNGDGIREIAIGFSDGSAELHLVPGEASSVVQVRDPKLGRRSHSSLPH